MSAAPQNINNPTKTFKNQVEVARKKLKDRLKTFEIEDRITIRIKDFSKLKRYYHDGLAFYRAYSQYQRGPIIWLRQDFPAAIQKIETELRVEFGPSSRSLDLTTELEITLFHEYGHVIWEYAGGIPDATLKKQITNVTTDEETFAESFGRWGTNRLGIFDPETETFEQILKTYRMIAFE